MELRREFVSYLEEAKLTRTGSINDLSYSLGIDGDAWVSEIVQENLYSQLLGGVHCTLPSQLSYQVKKLKEKNITPVFFFQGLSLDSEIKNLKKTFNKHKSIWEDLPKNNTLKIEALLLKKNLSQMENFREIVHVIRENGGEVVKCPAFVGHQIASLEKVLGSVAGGPELLAFGIPKVILDFDFEIGTFRYVLSNEVMKILGVSLKKFMEAWLVKGFWLKKKFTKLSITEILERLKNNDINKVVEEKLIKSLENCVGIVESPIFLSHDPPKINFKQVSDVPNLITNKCHEKLYFALCFFPLSSDLISNYIKKVEVFQQPLADSCKYRTLIIKYKPVMKKIYSVLNSCFGDPTSPKGIKFYYFYDDSHVFQLDFESEKLFDWDFLIQKLEEENKSEEPAKVDLQFSINWHMSHNVSEKSSQPIKTLESNQLSLKVYLNVLRTFGFISSQGTPTLIGKLLSLVKPDYQYEMFTLIELMKLGLLDWLPMTTIWIPETFKNNKPIEKEDLVRLVSRVCSMVAPTYSGESYASYADQDLAQFYSIVKLVSKTYQHLVEVLVLQEFVNGRISYSRQSILSALASVGSLPLYNVSTGIAVKKLINGKSLSEIVKEMPCLTDLSKDLEKAWKFWKEFQSLVKSFTNPTDTISTLITDASKLFKTSLITSGIHVT